jgi:hypothetical protein
MIAEWQKLLEQVEVRGDIFELTSEEELLEFEARTGIVLPCNYKEFCQVFGFGEFGNDLLNIHVISHGNLLSMAQVMERLGELISYQSNRLEYRKRTEIARDLVEQLETEGKVPQCPLCL